MALVQGPLPKNPMSHKVTFPFLKNLGKCFVGINVRVPYPLQLTQSTFQYEAQDWEVK
jgi:hypothetical protein